MTRFLLIMMLAALMFAACPPRFSNGNGETGDTAQAATAYRSELARLATATAAMRQHVQAAGMDIPEPRPEVLFPSGR